MTSFSIFHYIPSNQYALLKFFGSIDALLKIQCTYDGDFFLLQKMSEYFFFFCWPGGMVVCCCCRQLPRKIGFLRAKNRGTEKKKLSSREPAIFSKVIVYVVRWAIFMKQNLKFGRIGPLGKYWKYLPFLYKHSTFQNWFFFNIFVAKTWIWVSVSCIIRTNKVD